ncbi:MAG: hypothetical protein WDW38_003502 [Sanguina aurantia]
MGQAASGSLTQLDVDDLIAHTDGVFNQGEIEGLYSRFRTLDRGRKGYISADEFLTIPELSINPIAPRLVRLFDSINFRDFVKMLASFSPRAKREAKLKVMFEVYDIDGDGIITRDDMTVMLRQLAGSSLSDSDLRGIIEAALTEAGAPNGLNLAAFTAGLADADLSNMTVEFPVEF